MDITVRPGAASGTIRAIPSKSEAHRLLICAALADRPTRLYCNGTSEDIEATIRCLNSLGARIVREGEELLITPIDRNALPQQCEMDCGESGSTLRFLLPVAGALGVTTIIRMSGRLPNRPLWPQSREIARNGCTLRFGAKEGFLQISGKLRPGNYELPGNISSQFISGLLFALPLLEEDSHLTILKPVESVRYIDMTLQAMAQFGAGKTEEGDSWRIPAQGFRSPETAVVAGDWSNAAAWLCAGVLAGDGITVTGLREDSLQGDKAVCDILRTMGGKVTCEGDAYRAQPGALQEAEIDARNVPDLVPVLSAVAALTPGTTRFINAGRLRLKESDRLETIRKTLNALGADVTETADGLIIQGKTALEGGTVHAAGDHRIAMMAAVASIGCKNPVTVLGAQAVNKSYPAFWKDLSCLGKTVAEPNGGDAQ